MAEQKYVILEGSSSVGGRVNTVEMKNYLTNKKKLSWKPLSWKPLVDAGAQWLHGRKNALFDFAQKFNLIRSEESQEAEGDYICQDGSHIDEYLVKKVDFKFGQVLEECETFSKNKHVFGIKIPVSINEFVEEKFKKFIDDLDDQEKRKAVQLLDWHRKFQIIDNSCLHFNDLSAKNWGNYSFNGESEYITDLHLK